MSPRRGAGAQRYMDPKAVNRAEARRCQSHYDAGGWEPQGHEAAGIGRLLGRP